MENQVARTIAILVARLIFGRAFLMAACFKFAAMGDTSAYISTKEHT